MRKQYFLIAHAIDCGRKRVRLTEGKLSARTNSPLDPCTRASVVQVLIILCYVQVYNRVSHGKGRSFPERIHRFHQRDPLAGKLYVFALALMYVFYKIICFFQPEEVCWGEGVGHHDAVLFSTLEGWLMEHPRILVTFHSIELPDLQEIEVMPDATPRIATTPPKTVLLQKITPQQSEM